MNEEGAEEVSREIQDWWSTVRKQGHDFYKAGEFLKLPATASSAGAFHRSCEVLYVREVFSQLFEDICNVLQDGWLCHLNGNSGVGKSAFLWYFIVRSGIQYPHRMIVLETEGLVWELGPNGATVQQQEDYPSFRVLNRGVYYHLIDQRVDTSRRMGRRALVAASPDVSNVKSAKKLRDTFTRYMPVWKKSEIDKLVAWWREKLMSMEENSIDKKVLKRRLDGAELAFSWFGGIPRVILAGEPENFSDEEFQGEVSRCLADTNLENIRSVLQDRSSPNNVSWRLFHFNLKPGSLREFYYTFCSDKVAQVYTNYLLLTNRQQLELFIQASEPVPEYGTLRGFVFEQYVIGQCLEQEVVGFRLLDDVYCQACQKKDDHGKSSMVDWIKCDFCDNWYHMSCANFRTTVASVFKCISCAGKPEMVLHVSTGGLRLWYYSGELEDALMAAGNDAVNYLFRPLSKNNAVFDFVKPPRTLGQISVNLIHLPIIRALVDAVKALKAWASFFNHPDKDKDIILLYLLPPSRFPNFKFQRYWQSKKVSMRAVKGVIQCKVAMPVNGTSYITHDLKPTDNEEVSLDLAAGMDSWEASLHCQEAKVSDSWIETELVPLEGERERLMKLSYVQDIAEFVRETELENLSYRQLQGMCKQFSIPANTSREEMVNELKNHVASKSVSMASIKDEMEID